MAQERTASLDTTHRDQIHDIAYDFYGKRLVTCSSDQTIKVWDLEDGDWKMTQEIPAHCNSIQRVSWAHPEFGQVFASCSSDALIWIFEEVAGSKEKKFVKRRELLAHKGQVRDCTFAPAHLGLQIASIATDGRVKINVASDVMNLVEWQEMCSFEVGKKGYSLSWNRCRFEPAMLVVGSTEGAHIWMQKSKRSWEKILDLWTEGRVLDVAWAENMGRSYHLIAITVGNRVLVFKVSFRTSDDKKITVEKCENLHPPEFPAPGPEPHVEMQRVRWNVTSTILAAYSDDGKIHCWERRGSSFRFVDNR